MAAHLKTGCEQLITAFDEGKFNVEHERYDHQKQIIIGAINFDCFTSDDHALWPHGDLWHALNAWVYNAISPSQLGWELQQAYRRAITMWIMLDKPHTREEWLDRYFNDDEKTYIEKYGRPSERAVEEAIKEIAMEKMTP